MILNVGSWLYLKLRGFSCERLPFNEAYNLFIGLAELEVRNGLYFYPELDEIGHGTNLQKRILASMGLIAFAENRIPILPSSQSPLRTNFIPGDLIYTRYDAKNSLYCVLNQAPYLKGYASYHVKEKNIYPMVDEDMRFNVFEALIEAGIWSHRFASDNN